MSSTKSATPLGSNTQAVEEAAGAVEVVKDGSSGKFRSIWEDNRERERRIRKLKYIQTLLSLAVWSVFGEYLRFFMEQLFGSACHSQSTPSAWWWNKRNWAPCVTDPGNPDGGGAFFTDLPVNIIGCLIMGFIVSGDENLGVPVDLPVAFLPRENAFQKWTVTHLSMRTGFCGSLTTFSSWNTQMVKMIFNPTGRPLGTEWVSAFWGYAVGWMVSIRAFYVGNDLAIACCRRANPKLAMEADKIVSQRQVGVLIHRDLPDFERRFLHDILLEDEKVDRRKDDSSSSSSSSAGGGEDSNVIVVDQNNDGEQDDSNALLGKYGVTESCRNLYDKKQMKDYLHELKKWKDTTRMDGVHRYGKYANELLELERAILVDDVEPRDELLEIARDAGWAVDALQNWKRQKGGAPSEEVDKIQDSYWLSGILFSEFLTHSLLFTLCIGLLLWAAITVDEVPRRKQYMSALFSPLGTYARWYLSALNGRIKRKNWEWLPVGTLLANMIACVISALMAALQKQQYNSTVANLFISAISTGIAGCMSTVSTYATETAGLFRVLPRHFWGYYYSIGSLGLGLIVGTLAYFWVLLP